MNTAVVEEAGWDNVCTVEAVRAEAVGMETATVEVAGEVDISPFGADSPDWRRQHRGDALHHHHHVALSIQTHYCEAVHYKRQTYISDGAPWYCRSIYCLNCRDR